jgi:hypothetical protein
MASIGHAPSRRSEPCAAHALGRKKAIKDNSRTSVKMNGGSHAKMQGMKERAKRHPRLPPTFPRLIASLWSLISTHPTVAGTEFHTPFGLRQSRETEFHTPEGGIHTRECERQGREGGAYTRDRAPQSREGARHCSVTPGNLSSVMIDSRTFIVCGNCQAAHTALIVQSSV